MSRDPIGMGEALERHGLVGGAPAGATARLWQAWPEVAGAAVCGHVEPTSLREGVLRLRADSPVWATEVGYLADHIMARANQVLKGTMVEEVRVWYAPGPVSRPLATEPLTPLPKAASRDLGEAEPERALRRAYEAWRRKRNDVMRRSTKTLERGKKTL
jgi:hypothetical protein